MICEATYIGPWSGDTYRCKQKGMHLFHRGYDKEGNLMEWPNGEQYCATTFPGINDICKRPPKHKGLCRVQIHGRTVSFR